MSKTSHRQDCPYEKCDHAFYVRFFDVDSDRTKIAPELVDFNHVRTYHSYDYKTYQQREEARRKYEDQHKRDTEELKKKSETIRKLRDKLDQHDARKSKMELRITYAQVDPKNHIEGICDAVFGADGAVLKCTDPVRYGLNRCGLHVNHGAFIETEQKAKAAESPSTPAKVSFDDRALTPWRKGAEIKSILKNEKPRVEAPPE